MPFAPRPAHLWQLRTRSLALGPRTLLMAILNLTPDSFSDGNLYPTREQATARALTLLDAGTDILDLGAESTRPGSRPITAQEEQARLLPVLEAVLRARPAAILSVDTYHAATARLAVASGAEIVNDVSGHLWDPAMPATCASLACGVILMHTRGQPQDWPTLPPIPPAEVTPLVQRELAAQLHQAQSAGIRPDRIVLDPGFSFGKLGPENYALLADLDTLHTLGRPLLAGLSRKGFLAHTVAPFHGNYPPPPRERLLPTLAANTAAILAGAHILRVHDLHEAQEAAAIADSILHGV